MEREKLVAKPDKRKLCPKCAGEMHWCSEDRVSGHTMEGTLYKGCFAKGRAHPAEECFLCVFCDLSVPV